MTVLDTDFLFDKPLEDPTKDKLGYAPFAKQLATAIMRAPNAHELVYAVNGPWGIGKSTVLKFVEYYLQQWPELERPIVVHFNPWWFAGREDLTRRFLGQLQLAFTAHWKTTSSKLVSRVAALSDILSDIPVEPAKGLKVVSRLLTRTQKDVPELKREIGQLLQNQRQRIIVIADDIDRLTPKEIPEVFRTIKAVADFSNVTYLLAFDKDVVASVLSSPGVVSGEDYLDKIIQASFDMPLPDQSSLQRMLDHDLQILLSDTPPELNDQNYWLNVYFRGLRHFLRTPRNVNHLLNAVYTTYGAFKGEVNAVDYIAIEVCRAFAPILYDTIRRNETSFTLEHRLTDEEYEVVRNFHYSWLSQIASTDRDAAQQLVSLLFPKVGDLLNKTGRGPGWEGGWRKNYRICSSRRFPTYFQFAVPAGSISRVEMMTALAQMSNAEAIGARLVKLAQEIRPDGTSRLSAFLDELPDFLDDMPQANTFPLISAFFNVGDSLLRKDDIVPGLIGLGGNGPRIEIIVELLLLWAGKSNRSDPFHVLHQAIASGKSASLIVRVLNDFRPQDKADEIDGSRTFGSIFLTITQWNTLKDQALRVIRQAADDAVLLDTPELLNVILAWKEWADEAEVRTWVRSVTSDDNGLLKFVRQYEHIGFSEEASEVGTKRVIWIDPEGMDAYLDMETVLARLAKLGERDESAMDVAETLRQGYFFRQKGLDPNPLNMIRK